MLSLQVFSTAAPTVTAHWTFTAELCFDLVNRGDYRLWLVVLIKKTLAESHRTFGTLLGRNPPLIRINDVVVHDAVLGVGNLSLALLLNLDVFCGVFEA